MYPDLIQAMQSSQLAFLRERFPEDVSDVYLPKFDLVYTS